MGPSKPCGRCGGTERYKNGGCALCRGADARAYSARPEVKERRRGHKVPAEKVAELAQRRASPEFKARLQSIRSTPEGRAKARAYAHGTTVANLNAMLVEQANACAICR